MSTGTITLRQEILHLVSEFANGRERGWASRALANCFGADELIFFISDEDRDATPQPVNLTPRVSEDWQLQQFVERCQQSGFAQGDAVIREQGVQGRKLPATGIADSSGAVIVLLGAHLKPSDVEELRLLMPLLSAAIKGEHAAIAAATEAQEAGRAREEFLTIASHELKTPLTTVKGYIQILQRTLESPDAPQERISQAVHQLEVQTRRIEELVNDLLDASRIQQGRLRLRPEKMDLRETARRVVARFEQAPEREEHHTLHLDAPEPVLGEWDPFRIDQLMSNLVSNALKYSTDGGEIRVQVMGKDGHAEMVVQDEGMGISPEAQRQLFEPFFRDPEMKLRVGGTGLGLYITHQIAKSHGGEIQLESETGSGSTFTVRLPQEIPAELSDDGQSPDLT